MPEEKETLKIAKTFICACGTANRFEFETDFALNGVKINVRCQACGIEKEITLNDFVKLEQSSSPESIKEESNDESNDSNDSTFEEESAYADLFGRVK